MATRTTSADRTKQTRSGRTKSSLKKRIKTLVALSILFILTALSVGAVYVLLIFVQESRKLPSVAEIGSFKPSEGSQLFFSDGSVMAFFATENRKPIKLTDMGRNLIDATVATEDSRFYEHPGVDIRGVSRAIVKNVVGGEMKEGASTITQQLARNINELGIGREKRLRRKVAEAILAMKIEQSFSKDEILELYLNQIYYGKGAYGCEAAAKYYFNKSAKDLDLAEAALLAGIPQRPNKFSKDMDAAYKRRDWVLQRMLETGKITPGQRDTARAEQLKLTRKAPKGTTINGSPEVAYFVNYVMQQLVAEYGADEVYRGWKIYTTLHPDIQRAAEESLKYGVHHYDEAANQGALISLDPKSGAIRAMVGGLNYNKVQFNIITQGLRQPGSCFKPFVYAAAFDTDKADLDTRFTDDPDLSPHKTEDGWKPKNYSGKYSHRSMSVREAFRNSTNTVAVKVALDTGLETVINYAHRMGISTKIPPYAPIALGAAGVRPMELCSAYSVFENGGKRSIPYGIKKVLDGRGEVVVDNNPKAEDTQLRDTTITEVNEGLSEVVKHGSGAEAASVPNAHGKTGTTSDNRDAWFAGSTPELTTVIWVGHENRDSKGKLNKKHPYLEMPGATGGHLCAPIWRDFMLKAVPIQQAAIANANRLNNIRPPVVERDNPESGDVPPPNPNPKKQPIVKTVVPTNDGTTDPTPIDPTTPSGDTSAGTSPAPGTGAVTTPPISTAPGGPIQPSTSLGTPTAPPASVPVRSKPDVQKSGRVDSPNRMAEPSGRIVTPPVKRVDPMDDMVTVRVCADSQKRANKWCDAVVERRMKRRDIPGPCRVHKAPPGEGNG